MTDPAVAALAEIIHVTTLDCPYDPDADALNCPGPEVHKGLATAILAASPEGWCGHKAEMGDDRMTLDLMEAAIRKDQAELARLRKIEEAAQMFVTVWRDDADRIPLTLDSTVAALRAALGEEGR